MARMTLSVLGPPRLERDGVEVYLSAQKALGLVFFLAVQPGRAYSRSRLVAQLWEESGEREGRNSLSVALSRLRQSLPALPLVAEGDSLSWHPDSDTWVDAAEFARLTGPEANLADLEAAMALWRGPFLDGFAVRDSSSYDEWLRLERESWQERVLTVLSRLASAYEAAGEWERAVAAGRRALAIDPLQEHVHRAIMRVQARAGDRAAAIAQYRACQELLNVELGTEPDPETVALYESILHGQYSRRTPPGPAPVPLGPAPTRQVSLPPVRLAPPALPLVGREPDLERLRREVAEAERTGQGRLVVVQGEAGIGKSRLVEELLRTIGAVEPPAWGILLGHCYEAERSLPYRPFIDALTAVLPALDVPALGLGEVWLTEVARLLPDLASPAAALPAAIQLDPTQQRRRLFEGVARFLAALGTPLMLVLEDLHWADEGTLLLLSFLLHTEATRGLLVLATVRSEDLADDLAGLLRSLEREGRLTALRLERLSVGATTALMREMVHDPVAFLGERLYAETEGNPLFAVEMVRSLVEQGALLANGATGASALVLPDTVQAVIQSRLARLAEPERAFLNAAAILRRRADFDLVQAVSGLSEDVALDALETLLAAQLMRETIDRTHAAGDGQESYVFNHDKIRQVVYEGLSAARRRVLHRRALAALEAASGATEDLAYHAYHGQLWEAALTYSDTAASEATRVFGYAAATRLYEQALACLATLPADAALRRREVGLRLRLAQVGFYVEPGALTAWLAPAEQGALELGDDDLLTSVRLAQASALYIQGRFTEALPLLEHLASAPAIAANPDLRARYYTTLGRLLVLRGELQRARETLSQSLPLLEERGTPMEVLISTNMLAAAIAYQGEFAEALAIAEAMRRRAEELGDPTLIGVSLAFLEIIWLTRGDWAAAEGYGRQAIARSHESLNSVYEYVGHVFLGPALARQGDVAGALATARQALVLAERSRTRALLARAHGWLGEILLLAGQIDEGLEAARRGLAIADEHGWTLEGAICARVLAEAHTARGDWAAAESTLQTSLTVLTALGARPDLAWTEVVQARLAAARGQTARAAAARRRAADLFTAMGMAAGEPVPSRSGDAEASPAGN